jgi:hypothetical protein
MTARPFPPPWAVEEYNDACFIVRDHDGQQLAYVYYEVEPGRRSAAKSLSKDEVRRIAVNIAKLPEVADRIRTGMRCRSRIDAASSAPEKRHSAGCSRQRGSQCRFAWSRR